MIKKTPTVNIHRIESFIYQFSLCQKSIFVSVEVVEQLLLHGMINRMSCILGEGQFSISFRIYIRLFFQSANSAYEWLLNSARCKSYNKSCNTFTRSFYCVVTTTFFAKPELYIVVEPQIKTTQI